MTLEEKIQKDLVSAMKVHEERKMSALRSVKTAIQVEKTNGAYHELTDADVLKIIQKQVKQRLESEQIYLQASTPRYDLAENENLERVFLEEYLPKMLTEEEITSEIKTIIAEIGASSMKDMGKVMQSFNAKFAGCADGKVVSGIVKSLLS